MIPHSHRNSSLTANFPPPLAHTRPLPASDPEESAPPSTPPSPLLAVLPAPSHSLPYPPPPLLNDRADALIPFLRNYGGVTRAAPPGAPSPLQLLPPISSATRYASVFAAASAPYQTAADIAAAARAAEAVNTAYTNAMNGALGCKAHENDADAVKSYTTWGGVVSTPLSARGAEEGEFRGLGARSLGPPSLTGSGVAGGWKTVTPGGGFPRTRPEGQMLYSTASRDTMDLTFLECVAEILKGTPCLSRWHYFCVDNSRVWLKNDMTTICYRIFSKKGKGLPSAGSMLVRNARKVRTNDRVITVTDDQKSSFSFIFPSKKLACVWFTALCCLVPMRTAIKTKTKKRLILQLRDTYDPLRDSWGGISLAHRKWFDEYILLDAIGRGAFGKVKLALSKIDHRFYAVKFLSKMMMRKQLRNAAFKRVSHLEMNGGASSNGGNGSYVSNGGGAVGSGCGLVDIPEVAIMKILGNPGHQNVINFVATHDDVENDRILIVLEYVALGPVMNSSKLTGVVPMDKVRIRPVFVDALAGLMYMHSRGVAHRDFKPENLLYGGDLITKISDFGSAKHFNRLPSAAAHRTVPPKPERTAVGTPAFTAPEICLSDKSPPAPDLPFPADIWSLGVTLYYMWFGEAPFVAKSVFEMYDIICTNEVEFPSFPPAPAPLQNLLKLMLAKDPSKRACFKDILSSPWVRDERDLRVRQKVDKLLMQLPPPP